MKIELDFDSKIITLKSEVNIKELHDKLKTILPDWKEWKIEAVKTEISYWPGTTTIYPIINSPIQFPLPNQPVYNPDWQVTCKVGQYSIN